jgi:hypothetical protein
MSRGGVRVWAVTWRDDYDLCEIVQIRCAGEPVGAGCRLDCVVQAIACFARLTFEIQPPFRVIP